MSKANILTQERDEDFKTIYLKPIQSNQDLSWKAKGLWVYLISRPDTWEFYFRDLVNKSEDGRTAVKSAMKELKEAGLLKIDQVKDEEGKFQGIWTIAEDPEMIEEPPPENPSPGNPPPENPSPGNQQGSKKYSSKKELSKKNKSKPSDKSDNPSQDQFSISKKDNGRYDYPEDYERIYSLYPDNNGTKKSGWRKWAALRRKGVTQEDIVEAVKNYARVCQVENTAKKYVKHLSTFLGPDDHWREFLGDNFDINDYKGNGQKEKVTAATFDQNKDRGFDQW